MSMLRSSRGAWVTGGATPRWRRRLGPRTMASLYSRVRVAFTFSV
jgi:hypothetical protein